MTVAPYFDFLCSRCSQGRIPGELVSAQPANEPLVCAACRALEREPQGEAVRLFTPAPTQIAGQTGLGF